MSITSDNVSVTPSMFVGEYKYPDWFTHKTYSFYKKKLDHLARLRYIHTESAAYYDKQHFKLYAPSIIITGLSGVASFLASSSLFNDTTQTGLGIGVGVLASVSAMIQSAASAVDFSTKAKLHREAGEDYEKLMTKVEFEMEMPNEPEFIDNLETIILDIQNKCKYAAPRHIIEGYDSYLERKNKKLDKLTAKHNKRVNKLHNGINRGNRNSNIINTDTVISIPTLIDEQSPLIINGDNVSSNYGSSKEESTIEEQEHIIDFTNINDVNADNNEDTTNSPNHREEYIYDEETGEDNISIA